MSSVIRGTEFNYKIDTEYGINQDGFIAEGTESIVFKGIKYGNNLRYSCALKFKPKSRLHDFMNREYQILNSLQTCRSVVRVLDVIENLGDFQLPYNCDYITSEGYFCVVEEYIDGDSLQDYCIKQWYTYNTKARRWERNATNHSYPEVVKFQNQIIQFMINLCEIIKFVSNVNDRNEKTDSNGPIILHCDIKPENIMVTKHGKELVLIDFGRSQSISEGRTYQHYSDPQRYTFTADYSDTQWQDIGKDNFYAYGTVGYAAPECYASPSKGMFPFISQRPVLKHGLVSVESDIFGFGATFSECLRIYEICEEAFKRCPNSTDPRFFNREIEKEAETNVRNGTTENYCDRDFRGINTAFHEKLEDILRKCTHARNDFFQDPSKDHPQEPDKAIYYHNFHQLQTDIESARDAIPSLDRKSDPLVRQMVGVSGFCTSLTICFFVLFLIMTFFSNSLSWDKWNNLKSGYTDNQKPMMRDISNEMLSVPFQNDRYENLNEIIRFMHGGDPNDTVFDQDETEIVAGLLSNHVPDQSRWGEYINIIMQNPKTDNIDGIAKSIYRLNLSEEYDCDGYELATAIAQVNDADDMEIDKLIPAYNIAMKYQSRSEYKDSVSKLAAKLMTGKKIDNIASNINKNREDIRTELKRLA